MKIDEKVNKENIELFKRYGINNDDNIYTCVFCGKKVCADDSCSIEGHYLVCDECVFDKFDSSWNNCMKWQNEMLRKELENEYKNI